MKDRKSRLGLLVLLLLVCFALLPKAHAVVPAPDGWYPGANTAEGENALLSVLPAGHGNTAVGWSSLYTNTEGSRNTAIGSGALYFQTTADRNTAMGALALFNTTTGRRNTANGTAALVRNTTGTLNVAVGDAALESNTTGRGNVAVGTDALNDNITGELNTAIGYLAGGNITGSHNICIGDFLSGVAGENRTTRISNIYNSVASGRAVYVNSDNKIGTLMSSRRFKDDIKPMETASERILALKPVTFRYKKEIERNGAMMFGLIAEEVEKVAPDLVTRNDKGDVESVRYEAVNAMLLNEFLKEHRKVEELKKRMEILTAQLKDQGAQIQKVSARLEVSRPAPQTVLNNQ